MKWIAMCALLLSANLDKTPANFDTYCNGRYGYCIDYPTFLIPQPESDNGDGRIFINKEGKKILTVWGRLNQDAEGDPVPLQKQYELDIKQLVAAKNKITYQKLGKDFYVVSGEKNQEIFYHKMIRKEDAYCYALLSYNKLGKDVYDSVSVRMFKSFK